MSKRGLARVSFLYLLSAAATIWITAAVSTPKPARAASSGDCVVVNGVAQCLTEPGTYNTGCTNFTFTAAYTLDHTLGGPPEPFRYLAIFVNGIIAGTGPLDVSEAPNGTCSID